VLVALLIVLGIDLIVIVAFVTVVVGRRRWLKKQPGAFPSAIRVSRGDLDGIPGKWKRGTARYVRDVLVWSKAPFMFRTELIAIDRFVGERDAEEAEIKRLGDRPVVIQLEAGDNTIEIAASSANRTLLAGPFTTVVATSSL